MVQLQLINYLFRSVGALQFLASMPFDAISTNAAWSLLNQLISTSGDSTDGQNKLTRLKSLIGDVPSPEEMIFLFTALSNMAISRSKDDREFINCVAIDLLEVFFLSSFAISCTVNPQVIPPGAYILFGFLYIGLFGLRTYSRGATIKLLL